MAGRFGWKSVVIGSGLGLVAGFFLGSIAIGEWYNHANAVLRRRAAARQAGQQLSAPVTLPEVRLEPPETPMALDYRLPLAGLGGDRLSLEQFKGKVLVANVWATWCVPCLAELPSLDALAARFRGDDRFAFVLISKDARSNLERFLSTHAKPAIPIGLLGQEVELPSAEGAVPVTLIAAPDGRVKALERGAGDWNTDRVATFIRSLAAPAG